MKTENEMNEDLRQLLDSLEEHGKNVSRQKQLGDLIDRLAEEEKPVVMPRKRAKLVPIWWTVSAAAAILLLWILLKPNGNDNTLHNDILAEVPETVDYSIDSVKIENEDTIVEEVVVKKEQLAENTMFVNKTQIKKKNNRVEVVETVAEQPVVTEMIPMEISDTLSNETENTNPISEEPSAVHKPKRRVIRSLNLVCYECQNESLDYQFNTVDSKPEKTIFGQPQDPNIKDGALAWQVKLN